MRSKMGRMSSSRTWIDERSTVTVSRWLRADEPRPVPTQGESHFKKSIARDGLEGFYRVAAFLEDGRHGGLRGGFRGACAVYRRRLCRPACKALLNPPTGLVGS